MKSPKEIGSPAISMGMTGEGPYSAARASIPGATGYFKKSWSQPNKPKYKVKSFDLHEKLYFANK